MQTTRFSHNENQFHVEIINDNEVAVKKYTLDACLKKINLVEEFRWKCYSTVSLLGTASVIEFVTGCRIPVILVSISDKSRLSKEVNCYIFKVDSGKLIALRKGKINPKCLLNIERSETKDFGRSVTITDGPSLLVYGSHKISCFYSQKSCDFQSARFDYKSIDVSKYAPHTSCCRDINDINITCCSGADILSVYNSVQWLIVFTRLKLTIRCSSHDQQHIEILHALYMEHGKLSELTIEQFVPLEYLTVVTSMYIKHIVCDKSAFSSSLFIGTSNGFVLHISDGHVLKCIPLCSSDLDLLDTNAIHEIHLSTKVNNFNKMLICHEPGSKWTVLDENYKVACIYTDIIEVFLGDFTNDGTLTFLLLKEGDFENGQWVLTDLYSVDISNKDNEQKCVDGSAENTGSVLQALYSRLQRDQVEVERETKLYQKRTAFMKELCDRYSGNIPNNKSATQGDLVPLITGSGCHDNRGHLGSSGEGRMSLEIQDVWQRTFRDQWCVGVDFVNKCNRDVQVFLEIIFSSETSVKSSTLVKSKLSPCPASNFHSQHSVFSESETKKRKLSSVIDPPHLELVCESENKSCTIVSVTDMPDFSLSNTCSALLVLHVLSSHKYDSGSEELGKGDNSEDVEKGGNSKTLPATFSTSSREDVLISGGKIDISCMDVVTGRHEIMLSKGTEADDDFDQLKDIYRDKLALQSIQTSTHLTVKSTTGHLTILDTLLTTRAGFVYSSTLDCFYTSQTGLQNVQLTLEPVQASDSRNMEVYSRYEREVFMLIHHLYSCLPDLILILPRNPCSSVMKEHFLSCLNEEIYFLSHGINKLLQPMGAKLENEVMETDMADNGDLRKVGEKFKMTRDKLLQKQSETFSIDRTAALQQQMESVQNRTDMALARNGK